ncbi:MAG: hypothetical protein U1E50_15325 [Caulobacteraceae bacterium]
MTTAAFVPHHFAAPDTPHLSFGQWLKTALLAYAMAIATWRDGPYLSWANNRLFDAG